MCKRRCSGKAGLENGSLTSTISSIKALSNFPPPPHQTYLAFPHINVVQFSQGFAADSWVEDIPLVPALASLNHALAHKRQSATAPKDAAGKSKSSVVPQEFQGHLQSLKSF